MAERVAAASRWSGRAVAALFAAVVAVNAAWTVRHADQVRPVTPGDVAPYFEVPRLDGRGVISLERLRGQVVLLDFWATWCGPCRASMPAVERVHRDYTGRGLEVVSINTEGLAARPQVDAFVRSVGVTSAVAVDDGAVLHLYRGTMIPHMVLVDRRGLIRHVHRGASSNIEAELRAEIDALLGEP